MEPAGFDLHAQSALYLAPQQMTSHVTSLQEYRRREKWLKEWKWFTKTNTYILNTQVTKILVSRSQRPSIFALHKRHVTKKKWREEASDLATRDYQYIQSHVYA